MQLDGRSIVTAVGDLLTLARDAKIGSPEGPKTITDWLNLALADPVENNVKALTEKLTQANFDDAIKLLEEKRDAAAPTQAAYDAKTPEEQDAISELSAAIVVMRGKNEAIAAGKSPVNWIGENLLPIVKTAIPIVISLI